MSSVTTQTAQQSPSTPLMTVKGVALLLKCSPRSVYRMIDAGDIPEPLMVRGMIRFNPESIKRWIDAGCPSDFDSEE